MNNIHTHIFFFFLFPHKRRCIYLFVTRGQISRHKKTYTDTFKTERIARSQARKKTILTRYQSR